MTTHKHVARPCTMADIGLSLTPKESEEDTPELRGYLASYVGKIEKYLSQFVAPVPDPERKEGERHTVCFNCGSRFGNGLMASLGLGWAGMKWGLAHGEATCSKCDYPYRVHHFAIAEDGEELFTLQNWGLAYMPTIQKEGNQHGKA